METKKVGDSPRPAHPGSISAALPLAAGARPPRLLTGPARGNRLEASPGASGDLDSNPFLQSGPPAEAATNPFLQARPALLETGAGKRWGASRLVKDADMRLATSRRQRRPRRPRPCQPSRTTPSARTLSYPRGGTSAMRWCPRLRGRPGVQHWGRAPRGWACAG